MSLIYALKCIADLAFYFTFASVLTEGLLGASLVSRTVLLVPAVLYLLYNIIMRRRNAPFDYAKTFKLFLKIFIPFVVMIVFFPELRVYLERNAAPFAIIFLFCAAALLRMSKHDAQVLSQWPFRLMNAATVGVVIIAGWALGSQSFRNVYGHLASGIYRYLLAPLRDGFIEGFMFLYTRLLNLFPHIEPIVEREQPSEDMLMGEAAQAAESNPIAMYIILLLAVGIPIVLGLLKLFQALSHLRPVSVGTRIAVIRHDDREMTRTRLRRRDPVRRQFKRFLMLCWKQGIPKRHYLSSLDYASQAADRFDLKNEPEQLRAFYLPVRYGEKPATKESITAMKDLYKRIKLQSRRPQP